MPLPIVNSNKLLTRSSLVSWTPQSCARPIIRAYSTSKPSLITTKNIPAPHSGHIRILTLNSPHNKNAISWQLLSELSNEITKIKQQTENEWTRFLAYQKRKTGKGVGAVVQQQSNTDATLGISQHLDAQFDEDDPPCVGEGTRALIIGSEVNGVFCAGADLKERKGMSAQETQSFLTSLRQTLSTLSSLSIPSITAIASVALGGGFELALASTFRILSHAAILGLPETHLGILPGAGGTFRLKQLVGEHEALKLILTGKRITTTEARKLGLCTRATREQPESEMVAREMVMKMAVGFAREICEAGPVAQVAALNAVRMQSPRGHPGWWEEEMYEVVRKTHDRNEALRAFGEKRRPVFQGR